MAYEHTKRSIKLHLTTMFDYNTGSNFGSNTKKASFNINKANCSLMSQTGKKRLFGTYINVKLNIKQPKVLGLPATNE